jgi:predicted SAM-dependent methyltransferase
MNFTHINLGCGNLYKDKWCNVDIGNCKKDLDHNLEVFPWPIPSNVAVHLYASHIIEHIKKENIIPFMREAHRVLMPGGVIEIYSPHYTSKNAFADFTHQIFVTEDTFSYFCSNGKHRNYGKIYGIDFEFKEQHCGTYKESPESNLDIYHRLEKI